MIPTKSSWQYWAWPSGQCFFIFIFGRMFFLVPHLCQTSPDWVVCLSIWQILFIFIAPHFPSLISSFDQSSFFPFDFFCLWFCLSSFSHKCVLHWWYIDKCFKLLREISAHEFLMQSSFWFVQKCRFGFAMPSELDLLKTGGGGFVMRSISKWNSNIH